MLLGGAIHDSPNSADVFQYFGNFMLFVKPDQVTKGKCVSKEWHAFDPGSCLADTLGPEVFASSKGTVPLRKRVVYFELG